MTPVHRMAVNLFLYRVMFEDGTVVDFVDIGQSSDQRGAWRKRLGFTDKTGPAILGVAALGPADRIPGDDELGEVSS